MDNGREGCDEAMALTQPCDAVDDGDGLEEQASLRIKYGDGTVEVFRREESILPGMPALTILLGHLCRVQHACGVDLAKCVVSCHEVVDRDPALFSTCDG